MLQSQHIYASKQQEVYIYLNTTHIEGIHYWRTKQRKYCQKAPPSTPLTDYTIYEPYESKTTQNSDISNMKVDVLYR